MEYNINDRQVYDVVDTTVAFASHKYWYQELYRNLPKRKNIDRAEVMVAATLSAFYRSGIYMRPLGASWTYLCTKEQMEEYLAEYQDIWDDYAKWQWEQR